VRRRRNVLWVVWRVRRSRPFAAASLSAQFRYKQPLAQCLFGFTAEIGRKTEPAHKSKPGALEILRIIASNQLSPCILLMFSPVFQKD
jgi:hypothetical protein